MNALLRALQRRRKGGTRVQARVGMNMAQLSGRARCYANALAGYSRLLVLNDYNTGAPVDGSGNPTTDFMAIVNNGDTYSGPARAAQSLRFTAWCDNVYGTSSYAVGNKSYDAASNTTTLDYVDLGTGGSYPNNIATLKFVGTRRTGGASGPVNTGLTDLRLTAPGYTQSDIAAGKVWTDEAVAFASRFECLRFMDSQPIYGQGSGGANQDFATQWAGPGRSFLESPSFADLIGLANAAGSDPWFCVGSLWSDQSVRDFASLLDATLAPDRHVLIESANEAWNYGATLAHRVLRLTCAEVRGAIGGEGSYGFTYGRSGGVITITLTDALGWTAGHSLSVNNLAGITGAVTLTAASGTTATFSAAGADVAAGTNPGSGSWVVYDTSSNLCSPDNETNIYELRRRYSIRRCMQVSELIRGVVGDAKMGTRFRIVYADQMGNDPNAYDTPIQWLSTVFPQRAIGQDAAGSSGAYFWGFAGAPYFFSTQNQAGLTADQVAADLLSAAQRVESDYHFARWISVAKARGMKPIWYEGGPDTSLIGNQLPGSTNLQGADAQVRVAAQYLPAAGAALVLPMKAFFAAGGYMTMVYHNAAGSPTEDYSGAYAWAHYGRSLTDLTSGKPAAIAALQASGVSVIA